MRDSAQMLLQTDPQLVTCLVVDTHGTQVWVFHSAWRKFSAFLVKSPVTLGLVFNPLP